MRGAGIVLIRLVFLVAYFFDYIIINKNIVLFCALFSTVYKEDESSVIFISCKEGICFYFPL